jgi:predicted transcriptional regulator
MISDSDLHPDDEAEVRAGLEEAQRGALLSAEESAEYLRSLIGGSSDGK